MKEWEGNGRDFLQGLAHHIHLEEVGQPRKICFHG
jgi:hypothetical protein